MSSRKEVFGISHVVVLILAAGSRSRLQGAQQSRKCSSLLIGDLCDSELLKAAVACGIECVVMWPIFWVGIRFQKMTPADPRSDPDQGSAVTHCKKAKLICWMTGFNGHRPRSWRSSGYISQVISSVILILDLSSLDVKQSQPAVKKTCPALFSSSVLQRTEQLDVDLPSGSSSAAQNVSSKVSHPLKQAGSDAFYLRAEIRQQADRKGKTGKKWELGCGNFFWFPTRTQAHVCPKTSELEAPASPPGGWNKVSY